MAVSIKRSLGPSPFFHRRAARLVSKCIRLAFRVVKAEEDWGRGETGTSLKVCERVSPRARACTPLMAPSGYSRRTLSYLLFSAECCEEARGKGEESAGEGQRGRRGQRDRVAQARRGGRGFIRKHHTQADSGIRIVEFGLENGNRGKLTPTRGLLQKGKSGKSVLNQQTHFALQVNS